MKHYDLSHLLNNQSPVYPGTEKPKFSDAATLRNKGYRETHLDIISHLGTHIDAPAHMLEKGKTLDQMTIDAFTGQALIISVPEKTRQIEKQLLLKYEKEMSAVDFVLFRTGWSRYWGLSNYFQGFPVLTMDSVTWLLSYSLKGIGFDVVSADPVESTTWDNHLAIFGKGAIIIENLIFPEEMMVSRGMFSCFPLFFEKADGSPVRAVFSA